MRMFSLTLVALSVLAVAGCGGGRPVSIAEACTGPGAADFPKCQNARLVQIAVEAARR